MYLYEISKPATKEMHGATIQLIHSNLVTQAEFEVLVHENYSTVDKKLTIEKQLIKLGKKLEFHGGFKVITPNIATRLNISEVNYGWHYAC